MSSDVYRIHQSHDAIPASVGVASITRTDDPGHFSHCVTDNIPQGWMVASVIQSDPPIPWFNRDFPSIFIEQSRGVKSIHNLDLSKIFKKYRSVTAACVAVFDPISKILKTANWGKTFCIVTTESGVLSFKYDKPQHSDNVVMDTVQMQPNDVLFMTCQNLSTWGFGERLGMYLQSLKTKLYDKPIGNFADETMRYVYAYHAKRSMNCIVMDPTNALTRTVADRKPVITLYKKSLPSSVRNAHGIGANINLSHIDYPYDAGECVLELNEPRLYELDHQFMESLKPIDRVIVSHHQSANTGAFSVVNANAPDTLVFQDDCMVAIFKLAHSANDERFDSWMYLNKLFGQVKAAYYSTTFKFESSFGALKAATFNANVSIDILISGTQTATFLHLGNEPSMLYSVRHSGSLNHIDSEHGEVVKLERKRYPELLLSTFPTKVSKDAWRPLPTRHFDHSAQTWFKHLVFSNKDYPDSAEMGAVAWSTTPYRRDSPKWDPRYIMFDGKQDDLRYEMNAWKNGFTSIKQTIGSRNMRGVAIDLFKPSQRTSMIRMLREQCVFVMEASPEAQSLERHVYSQLEKIADSKYTDDSFEFDTNRRMIAPEKHIVGSIMRFTEGCLEFGSIRDPPQEQHVRCLIRENTIRVYEQFEINVNGIVPGDVAVVLTLKQAEPLLATVCERLSQEERKSHTVLFDRLFDAIRKQHPDQPFGLFVAAYHEP